MAERRGFNPACLQFPVGEMRGDLLLPFVSQFSHGLAGVLLPQVFVVFAFTHGGVHLGNKILVVFF